MAAKYLRKIILEELRKVLKEVEYTPEQRKKLEDEAEKDKRAAESGEDLRQQRLKAFGDDPENMAQQDREDYIRKNAPYSEAPEDTGDQLGYTDEPSVLAQLKARRSGVACEFATTIQGLIRNKIKLTSPALMGRVKDGRMGFVTSSIINYVIDYGVKNRLDTQGLVKIPLTVKGYKNACFATTPQQKQKLIELFGKIPVKVIEKATQMASNQAQSKPASPESVFDPIPGEMPPPKAPPATQPESSIGKRMPSYRSNFNVGDVQAMEDMPLNIGVWDGNNFITVGAAKDKGIKIKRASLNPQTLAILEKDSEYKGMLYENLLKKEIAKLLKQL